MSNKKAPADTCVLVTGGAGFIGSHTVVDLLESGYQVVVVDDLSNASEKVLDRIDQIVGDEASERLSFVRADVCDRDALEAVFDEFPIDAVIHFAGFKAVGESVAKPVEYYSNNLGSTLTLVDAMRAHGCKSIIFSSSATVYGDPDELPLTEASPKKPATNPYGWTKWMVEQILMDVAKADPEWDVVLLRYFNPIGAGVRDYIHVMDLARGHVAALGWMAGRTGCEVFNLGTGKGTSVLEIIHAFSAACGRELPYVIEPRRAGDVTANWADCTKARELMGWEATRGIADMCRDSWNWQSNNPNGYEG